MTQSVSPADTSHIFFLLIKTRSTYICLFKLWAISNTLCFKSSKEPHNGKKFTHIEKQRCIINLKHIKPQFKENLHLLQCGNEGVLRSAVFFQALVSSFIVESELDEDPSDARDCDHSDRDEAS